MKVSVVRGETVVAACDRELLGQSFSEGKKRLCVDEDFYGCQEATREDLVAALEKATIANLTGEQAVGIAREAGHVSGDGIITIDGVPHAQIFIML